MNIKKCLHIILFAVLSFRLIAVEPASFEVSFPGGEDAMNEFINTMVDAYYPNKAQKDSIEGIVSISATIDCSGYLNNPTIIKSLSEECDETALSIVQSMPKWNTISQHFDNTLSKEIVITIPFFINSNRKEVYGLSADKLPEVEVNMQDLMGFIANNLRYPPPAAEKGIQGRVMVQFILDENGKAKYPRILQGVSPEINQEVIRLINILPKYPPGKYKDEAVPMFFAMPIQFKLQ